jgi:hypothetical protein
VIVPAARCCATWRRIAAVVRTAPKLVAGSEPADFVGGVGDGTWLVRYLGLDAHEFGLVLIGGDLFSLEIGCMLLRIHCVEHPGHCRCTDGSSCAWPPATALIFAGPVCNAGAGAGRQVVRR